jgi:hypothetical protein
MRGSRRLGRRQIARRPSLANFKTGCKVTDSTVNLLLQTNFNGVIITNQYRGRKGISECRHLPYYKFGRPQPLLGDVELPIFLFFFSGPQS